MYYHADRHGRKMICFNTSRDNIQETTNKDLLHSGHFARSA